MESVKPGMVIYHYGADGYLKCKRLITRVDANKNLYYVVVQSFTPYIKVGDKSVWDVGNQNRYFSAALASGEIKLRDPANGFIKALQKFKELNSTKE